MGLGIEPSDPGVQHRADGAGNLDVREVDLSAPMSFGVRSEHARLDEMTHELDREQRVPVGLLLEVGRHRPSVVTELVTRGRLEQGGQRVGGQALDRDVGDRRQGSKLREDIAHRGHVSVGRPVGAEQHERARVAQAREPDHQEHGVAIGPLEVVEDEQDRLVAGRATHQVGDRLEEKPPAGLGIDGVGEWQRADASSEVRREASDLAALVRDVLDEHRGRRAADVLDDRVAERFIGRAHVLVARAEEHSPVLSVRHTRDGRRHARLAGAGLTAEKHGLDGAFEGSACVPHGRAR